MYNTGAAHNLNATAHRSWLYTIHVPLHHQANSTPAFSYPPKHHLIPSPICPTTLPQPVQQSSKFPYTPPHQPTKPPHHLFFQTIAPTSTIATPISRYTPSRTPHAPRVGQNHKYTEYMWYSWQGNHQIYSHIRCTYSILTKPTHTTPPNSACMALPHAFVHTTSPIHTTTLTSTTAVFMSPYTTTRFTRSASSSCRNLA